MYAIINKVYTLDDYIRRMLGNQCEHAVYIQQASVVRSARLYYNKLATVKTTRIAIPKRSESPTITRRIVQLFHKAVLVSAKL